MTRLAALLIAICIVPLALVRRKHAIADEQALQEVGLQLSVISPDGKEIQRGVVTFDPLNAKPRGKFTPKQDMVMFDKDKTFSAVLKDQTGRSWFSTTQRVCVCCNF